MTDTQIQVAKKVLESVRLLADHAAVRHGERWREIAEHLFIDIDEDLEYEEGIIVDDNHNV